MEQHTPKEPYFLDPETVKLIGDNMDSLFEDPKPKQEQPGSFEQVVESEIAHAYGFGGDSYVRAILAAHEATTQQAVREGKREVLERYLRMVTTITGANDPSPYEEVFDTTRFLDAFCSMDAELTNLNAVTKGEA